MDKPILERAIGTIQQDRLSGFVKEAHDRDDGCFYYALISCFNYLYPDRLIPRAVEEKIRQGQKMGKGVKASEFISEVKRLQPELGLKVDHIINHTDQSIESIRKVIPETDQVTIIDSEDGWVRAVPGVSTAVTLLKRKNEKNRGHFFALVENSRFQDEGEVMGGNTEYQRIKDRYVGVFSFIIVKSE